MTNRQSAHFADLIQRRLADLDAEDALGRAGQSVVTLDQQAVGRLSRQDALLSQSMSKATQARRNAERQALLQAAERINTGTFGFCEECGEDIAPKRLELDPSKRLCVSCASGRA